MIDIAPEVTHWSCGRLSLATGQYEKLMWGPEGAPAVSRWKIPKATERTTSGMRLVRRVERRWGPGMYRVTWSRPHPETGHRQSAGHVEFKIAGPAVAPAPPAVAPIGPQVGAYPGAAPGYPYPYPAPGFSQMPPGMFPPLDGFNALYGYARDIRGQEREDAKESAQRYRAEIDLQISRERLLYDERMQLHERAAVERAEMAKRDHDLAMKRIDAELQATRAMLAKAPKDDPIDAVLEELEELKEELASTKQTAASAGQEAMGILRSVIEQVGGPVGQALGEAVKRANGKVPIPGKGYTVGHEPSPPTSQARPPHPSSDPSRRSLRSRVAIVSRDVNVRRLDARRSRGRVRG